MIEEVCFLSGCSRHPKVVKVLEDEVLASIQNVIDAVYSKIARCDISAGFWDIFKPPGT